VGRGVWGSLNLGPCIGGNVHARGKVLRYHCRDDGCH